MPEAADRGLVETVELVREAKSGNREAAEVLFDRYYPCVRQVVALRMQRTAESLTDYEDVVQDVMVRLFMNLDKFEHRSEATFRDWVCRCVQNGMVDFFRKQRASRRGRGKVVRQADLPTSFLLATVLADQKAPSPIDQAMAAELGNRIEAELQRMPEHHREVFIMKRLLGMTHAEVAGALRVSETNARQMCYLAAHRLKERLKL